MKKLVTIGLVIAILFAIGCKKGGGSNTPPTPSNTATGIIGANGGVITSTDGKATIQIPAGALTADTTISVTTVTENLGQIGSMHQVTAKETAELVFSMPVTLKFNYDPSLLSAGAIEQDSKLAFLEAYDSWEIFPDSAVDTVNHVITATTTHFSNVGWIQTFPDSAAPKLGFPLDLYTPYNAPITSVFDHSMTTTHCPNSIVTAFTGEQGTLVDLNESSLPALNCPGQRLYSYKKDSVGTPFTINGNYVGTSSPGTLNYDGHAGYDYPVAYVDIFSAASGTVRVWKESTCLKKVGLNGGAVTTLASGLHNPQAITIDSTSVYLTDTSAFFATGSGCTIKKIAK